MGLALTVGFLGLLILFHAAYSTIQCILKLIIKLVLLFECWGSWISNLGLIFVADRGVLKITEEEFSGLPFEVVIELFLGLLLCFWTALTAPGKFLSIHPHSEENRIVSLPANPDFMIFNHRGKVFPVEMDLKLRQ
ncbi:hypothetical protein GLYMA_03G182900v4 [Glycine max]|nr:hypothetical protein GLYMA_03G182900v4 [Glycine max]KAG5043778.1 hypothetical protein JHK87_007693 [Glycine soja]KAH1070641.1 hypothetical protein GYH30_007621 [Glycine max]